MAFNNGFGSYSGMSGGQNIILPRHKIWGHILIKKSEEYHCYSEILKPGIASHITIILELDVTFYPAPFEWSGQFLID